MFLDILKPNLSLCFQDLIDSYTHRCYQHRAVQSVCAACCSQSLKHSIRACFVTTLYVPKGVQIRLVKELFGTTFSYHIDHEDFSYTSKTSLYRSLVLCDTEISFSAINQWNCSIHIYWVIKKCIPHEYHMHTMWVTHASEVSKL